MIDKGYEKNTEKEIVQNSSVFFVKILRILQKNNNSSIFSR